MEKEFLDFWNEIQTTTPDSCDDESEEIENQTILSNCEDIEEIFGRIRSLLLEKKFKTALSLLKKTKDQFPNDKTINENIIQTMNKINDEEDSDDETETDITVIEWVLLMF